MNPVHVVGIGDDGAASLTEAACRIVEQAELLAGGERHLAFFPSHPAERLVLRSNLAEAALAIQRARETRRVVVLASGDPLFHGIARYLMTKIPKEGLVIHPQASAMQIAFARAKESWEDALLLSVHAKALDEVLPRAAGARKVGLFTDDKNTPARIARWLLDAGEDGFRAIVCENLAGADERVTEWESLEALAGQSFSELNVVILLRRPKAPEGPGPLRRRYAFGIPEHEFFQREPHKGLITKTEVRVLALARMNLGPDAVVWDVGAGSGSVGIEAARLAPAGKVYAIEKNREDFDLISKNAERFGTRNLVPVQGIAPGCFREIPEDPDAVFVGGSGGDLGGLLDACLQRLRPGGRLVATFATAENLGACLAWAKSKGLPAESVLLQASRGKPLLEMTRFEGQNPVWIVSVEKG